MSPALRSLPARVAVAAATLTALAAAPAAHAAIGVDHVQTGFTEVGGNGDGIVAPGESFALTERIRHADVAPWLTNVQGSLRYDPGTVAQAGPTLVTLTNANSPYPDMSAGAEADNLNPFTGNFSSSADCGVKLDFVLTVSATQGTADVPFSVSTGQPGPSVAQESADVPTAIPDGGNAMSALTVGGSGRIKDIAVRIGSLTHARTGDLKIELVSPNNVAVTLVDSEGGAGQDFSNTTFSDSAAQPISGASAPFSGVYRPEQSLSKLVGRSKAGTWHLRVTDQTGTHTGTLNAWGVDVRTAVCSGNPVAAFTATPNPVLPGSPVELDASESTDVNGTITQYAWDLDADGTYDQTSATPTLSHIFATRGRRPVTLRVTDADGNEDTTTVDVSVTQPPSATFTVAPLSPETGDAVDLDGSGSSDPDGILVKYEWDLDGNGTFEHDTGATATAQTSFASPGTRTVRLRVTDDDGATATHAVDVVVRNRAPTAHLAGPSPAVTGQRAELTAAGSSDPDGTIDRYEWDLNGDGTYETDTAAVATVQHTFAASGPATVGVRVTDDQGATATDTEVVNVTDAPVASFTATPNPTSLHRSVQMDASASSDSDGTIAKFEWDLDGDGSFEVDSGTAPAAGRVYDANGTYTVGLRVTDDDGATAVASVSVVAANKLPTAGLVVTPGSATAGQPVLLDARGSADPDGTVVKYDWDLDGNGSFEATTGAAPTRGHTYPNAGRFNVGVRIADNDGGVAVARFNLLVDEAPAGGADGGGSTGGGSPGGGGSTGGGSPGGGDGAAGPERPAARLTAALTGSPLQPLRLVATRGLALGCRADRAATCAISAELRSAEARRLGLRAVAGRPVVVGRATLVLRASGTRTVRLRLTPAGRRALARARQATVLVRGSVHADGRTVRTTRTFLLRR